MTKTGRLKASRPCFLRLLRLYDELEMTKMHENARSSLLIFKVSELRQLRLSRKGTEVPERLKDKVTVASGTPLELLRQLAAAGARDVYVDGGETLRGFLEEGLLTRIIVSATPPGSFRVYIPYRGYRGYGAI